MARREPGSVNPNVISENEPLPPGPLPPYQSIGPPVDLTRQESYASSITESAIAEEYRDRDSIIKRDDPLATRRVSSTRTMLNIIKGMIGPGCLSLPLAFKFGGLWTGLALITLIGVLTSHSMTMLVHCAQHLCTRSGKLELDYGHLAKKAIDYGPLNWRRHSRKALYFTNTMVLLFQVGVCSVQFVFMGANLSKVVDAFNNNGKTVMPTQAWIAVVLLPVILVNFERRLRVLALFSAVGNIFLLIAFLVIFQLIARPPNCIRANKLWFEDFNSLLLFLGAALYAFEGQAMILPMENRMKNPEDLNRPFGVLHASMALVVLVYGATGFFGYAKFGELTHGSITLDLPDEPLYQAVIIVLVIVVFFGMPVQEFVIIAALWPSILRKLPSRLKVFPVSLILEYSFRIFAILIQFVLAILIPRLDQIVPLVGVTAGMVISFILPASLEMITFWNFWQLEFYPVKRHLMIAKDVALVCVGLFGIIAGLYVNILTIVNDKTGDADADISTKYTSDVWKCDK